MPLPEKIEYLFSTECLYESTEFDLISLGIKWTEGCYCFPNNLIRGIIPKLARNYAHTLIDAPAGLEHLNRNVTSEVDDLFLVLDPSLKSLKNIERIRRLTKEVGITYRNFYMVANYRFNEEMENYLQTYDGTYLGKISLSVKGILEKAGYQLS
jgi:CO dehydrogenase maturation factor